MALTTLDVYKLLPKTNCKECGFPTCLAFAMQVAAGKAGIDKCPPASAEAREKLGAACAPPLAMVTVGAGEQAVVMGDEVVLYRHEKTFYHPTALAISIADTLPETAFTERLQAIRSLVFERVGLPVSVDLIAVRGLSGDPARFAAAAARALAEGGKPLVLLADGACLAAAVDAVGGSRPLLAPPPGELAAGARLAVSARLPLLVCARGLDELKDALASARAAGVTELVAGPLAASGAEAAAMAITVRRLAILRQAPDMACPTAFDLGGDFPRPFAAASLLIPKYGSLLILDSVDPAELLPLLTLRQNIFTDPQKPIQVKPGIYEIGAVTPRSPVLITTNFSLTFFTVRGDIEAAKTPAWLLIAECDGMSVLTAWAAGKFSGESVARILAESGIAQKVNHRALILPGMVARLSGKIEELSGWKVLVGPQESSAIPAYLRRLPADIFQEEAIP